MVTDMSTRWETPGSRQPGLPINIGPTPAPYSTSGTRCTIRGAGVGSLVWAIPGVTTQSDWPGASSEAWAPVALKPD